MPPRLQLSTPSALRIASTSSTTKTFSLSLRPFSLSASASAPPRHAHPSPSSTATPATTNNNNARTGNADSSTSRLLSLNRDAPPRGAPAATSGEVANRLFNRYKERADVAQRKRQAAFDFLREQKTSNDYLAQMPRRWRPGDVYSPHDLSPVEMRKWRKSSERTVDIVDALGLEPKDMYKNFSMIQDFTHSSGQIKGAQLTKLRPVNQRKIAKMIRRAQGMGLYPTIHSHPELIRSDFYPLGSK